MPATAALTVNGNPALAPPDVVTVSVCVPTDVVGSKTSVTVSDVALPTTRVRAIAVPTMTFETVTPDPLTVTEVAPGTNGPPLTVTVAVVPAVKVVALRPVTVGVFGLIVSVSAPLAPPG